MGLTNWYHKVLIVGGVVGTSVLLWFLAIYLLAMTSECGFARQWNAFVLGSPQVPLPEQGVMLSERGTGNQPIQSGGGTDFRVYGELYYSPMSDHDVATFYQQQGASCVPNESQEGEALWFCDVPNEHGAWIDVDLFQAIPDFEPPSVNRSIDYHVTQDIPNEGTIIRVIATWCDDA